MRNEKNVDPTHPFTDKTRQLFVNTPCWQCGAAAPDALHHIMKRVSASPLNCAPLHNATCHLDRGDIHKPNVRWRYLWRTLVHLREQNYQWSPKDKAFYRINYAEFVYAMTDDEISKYVLTQLDVS